MYKVAVVIPIYNMELFLDDAVKSVINQTIGFENVQLVLVNDGSTDGSYAIMKKYENNYQNVTTINLPTKSGAAGKPRNVGLTAVNAEYVMFLDPDDFYDKNALKIMYDHAKENNADIVTANYRYANEDGSLWNKSVFDTERFKSFTFTPENFSNSFFVWNSGSCNKLFKMDLLKKNDIKFLEGVPAEDAYFTYDALLNANKVCYLSDTIHYYRRRNKLGTLSVSWDRNLKYFKDVSYAYKEIYGLFQEKNKMSLFRYFYSKTLTSVFYKIVDTKIMNRDEKKEALKELEWLFKLRGELDTAPCQKSLESVFEKTDNGDFDEAVKYCDVIGELRTYVEKDVREGMSKPEFVNYVEL